jgi:hypothetical protein
MGASAANSLRWGGWTPWANVPGPGNNFLAVLALFRRLKKAHDLIFFLWIYMQLQANKALKISGHR